MSVCWVRQSASAVPDSSLVLCLQVNEFVKRVRAAKIHTLIIGHLRKQMPAMMGKQKAQEKLLRELPTHFAHVQREHHLPAGA
jgi:EH domain-containing protein 1